MEKTCPNHPEAAVTKRCSNCRQDFCQICIQMTDGGAFCPDCVPLAPPKKSSLPLIIIVVCVVLVFGCAFVAIIAAIAIPNLVQARKHGNEASAIGALKTIGTSEAIFREGDKDHNDILDYGSLALLNQTQIVDSVLGSGTKQGYFFQVEPGADPLFFWWGVARPAVPGTTGDRAFFTNQSGIIYWLPADDPRAAANPDPKTCEPPTGALPIGSYRR